MSEFSLLLAILAVGMAIACGWSISSLQKRAKSLEAARREIILALSEAANLIVILKSEIESMRATAGPLPLVMLRRTTWEQGEMALEMQSSEVAAVMARMDAQEEVLRLVEERIQRMEWSSNWTGVVTKLTEVSVEIRRHMETRRSDFEMQAIRRIDYCEKHVDHITERFNQAELKDFTVKSARKGKSKIK